MYWLNAVTNDFAKQSLESFTPSERWWPVRDGFDVREGQLQGRLNRWMAHFVHLPPLPSVGVVTARQGFASAAKAPLTGLHSNNLT